MAPSLQFATEKVNLKSFASIRDRELQLPNMLVKLLAEETAVTLSAGTLDKEVQPLNMEFVFVTATVLNNGTVVRLVQALNISCMFVTNAVLNNGTVVRLVQPPNMLNIFVTD